MSKLCLHDMNDLPNVSSNKPATLASCLNCSSKIRFCVNCRKWNEIFGGWEKRHSKERKCIDDNKHDGLSESKERLLDGNQSNLKKRRLSPSPPLSSHHRLILNNLLSFQVDNDDLNYMQERNSLLKRNTRIYEDVNKTETTSSVDSLIDSIIDMKILPIGKQYLVRWKTATNVQKSILTTKDSWVSEFDLNGDEATRLIKKYLKERKEKDDNDLLSINLRNCCEFCLSPDNADKILICNGCDLQFHISCLRPPLLEIPTSSWYCDECVEERKRDKNSNNNINKNTMERENEMRKKINVIYKNNRSESNWLPIEISRNVSGPYKDKFSCLCGEFHHDNQTNINHHIAKCNYMSSDEVKRGEKIIKSTEGNVWNLNDVLYPEMLCAVCFSEDVNEDEEFVYCDKCNIGVHTTCYNIEKLPSGNWYCHACQMTEKVKEYFISIELDYYPRRKAQCCLCSFPGGALCLDSKEINWLHMCCAILPEVWEDKKGKIHDIEKVDPKRFKLKCEVCVSEGRKEITGACIQCSYKNCLSSMHPLCAYSKDLVVLRDADESEGLTVYCSKHLNMAEKKRSLSASPS